MTLNERKSGLLDLIDSLQNQLCIARYVYEDKVEEADLDELRKSLRAAIFNLIQVNRDEREAV